MSEIGIESPSTVNATISARLARAEEKRSTSRLYGARVSPTRIPASSTARKPDPCAAVVTPYSSRAKATARSGYRASLGIGRCRSSQRSPIPPARPNAMPSTICNANSRAPCADRAPPGTGGAEDRHHQGYPDRVVGARPRPRGGCRCDRRPRAGRAPRTPSPGRWAPARCRAAGRGASRSPAAGGRRGRAPPAVTNVPATPSQTTGPATGRNRDTPDVHAAVEQDHHDRDGDDALVGDHRQRAEGREDGRGAPTRRPGTGPGSGRAATTTPGSNRSRGAGRRPRRRPSARRGSRRASDGSLVCAWCRRGSVGRRRPDFPAHR